MRDEFERHFPDWVIDRREYTSRDVDQSVERLLWTDEQGQLELAASGSGEDRRYRLRMADQLAVDIDVSGRSIVERPLVPDIAPATRDHFLADQVLPRILGHYGKLVLHAAAVRVGDDAILLLGKSGRGKSTLAASLDKAGTRLLGDDAVVISRKQGAPCAAAVYPSLRLFPDSIDALFADGAPTAAVAHYSPKLRVEIPLKDDSDAKERQVRAIFVLDDGAAGSEVRLSRKSVAAACIALVENSFVLDPTDAGRAAGRLQQASLLAGDVPAFDLCYPRAYSRLPDVRAAILSALG